MAPTRCYYCVLGVAVDVSQDEIKVAFKALAKKHHPDKSGSTDAFVALRDAYEVIADKQARAAYDRLRVASERSRGKRSSPPRTNDDRHFTPNTTGGTWQRPHSYDEREAAAARAYAEHGYEKAPHDPERERMKERLRRREEQHEQEVGRGENEVSEEDLRHLARQAFVKHFERLVKGGRIMLHTPPPRKNLAKWSSSRQ